MRLWNLATHFLCRFTIPRTWARRSEYLIEQMNYLSHTSSFLFRFSHGARFRKTVALIDAQPGQTILDYGCADGRLLSMLPDTVNKIGYDPNPEYELSETAHLPCCSCDVVTVCEVLEHVSTAEAVRILSECQRLLKPEGRLIVSVPIETGLPCLVKSVARWIKVRPLERQMTIWNVLRSACYFPAKREPEYLDVYGHTGFDYTEVERMLKGFFTIRRRVFSPVPMFGWVLNSQVFYVVSLVS